MPWFFTFAWCKYLENMLLDTLSEILLHGSNPFVSILKNIKHYILLKRNILWELSLWSADLRTWEYPPNVELRNQWKVALGQETKVCKLTKYLYGIKRTPRAWYIKIDENFAHHGWKRSAYDPNLYCKDQGGIFWSLLCMSMT